MRGVALMAFFFLLAGCDQSNVTVLSMRTSPDGTLVAENVLTGNDGDGQLRIRAKNGSEQYVDFAESHADAFLKWIDNQHLEVWTEGKQAALGDDIKLGTVWIIPKHYEYSQVKLPDIILGLTGKANENTNIIMTPADNVVSTFIKSTNWTTRLCILKIGANFPSAYAAAQVEITASVNPACSRRRPCAAIDTRFALDHDSQLNHQKILTSSTISGIPSYNSTSIGDGGKYIRG